jgi:hypothetical protein
MQDRERRIEARRETLDQLRRQRDLGHQHEGLPALRNDGLDRAQVHLGLAAAGHAAQQELRVAAERGDDSLDRLLLLGKQRRAGGDVRSRGQRRFSLLDLRYPAAALEAP